MDEPKDTSLDVLGVKPVASSIEKITDGIVDGARAFLSRVCLPAAEEFGLLVQDNIKAWRAANAIRIARRAKEMLEAQNRYTDSISGNPRVLCNALEQGSWNDDPVVQDLWAGLLASACDEFGGDDRNIVFISILSQLNSGQVRLLRYAVEQSSKYVSEAGWAYSRPIDVPIDKLKEIFQTDDIHRIDISLDHLRILELTGSSSWLGSTGGFAIDTTDKARIRPSALAMNMYLAGEGTIKNATEYWQLDPHPPADEAQNE